MGRRRYRSLGTRGARSWEKHTLIASSSQVVMLLLSTCSFVSMSCPLAKHQAIVYSMPTCHVHLRLNSQCVAEDSRRPVVFQLVSRNDHISTSATPTSIPSNAARACACQVGADGMAIWTVWYGGARQAKPENTWLLRRHGLAKLVTESRRLDQMSSSSDLMSWLVAEERRRWHPHVREFPLHGPTPSRTTERHPLPHRLRWALRKLQANVTHSSVIVSWMNYASCIRKTRTAEAGRRSVTTSQPLGCTVNAARGIFPKRPRGALEPKPSERSSLIGRFSKRPCGRVFCEISAVTTCSRRQPGPKNVRRL